MADSIRPASVWFTLAVSAVTIVAGMGIVAWPAGRECLSSSNSLQRCLRGATDDPVASLGAPEATGKGWIDARATEVAAVVPPSVVLEPAGSITLDDSQAVVPAIVRETAPLAPSIAADAQVAVVTATQSPPLQEFDASAAIGMSVVQPMSVAPSPVALVPDAPKLTLDLVPSVPPQPSAPLELTAALAPDAALTTPLPSQGLPEAIQPTPTLDIATAPSTAPQTLAAAISPEPDLQSFAPVAPPPLPRPPVTSIVAPSVALLADTAPDLPIVPPATGGSLQVLPPPTAAPSTDFSLVAPPASARGQGSIIMLQLR